MRSSRISFIANASKLSPFDRYEVLSSLLDTVAPTSSAAFNPAIDDLGVICNFMKKIGPQDGKVVVVKSVNVQRVVSVDGANDATEDAAELACSLYMYRDVPLTDATPEHIQQRIQNNSLVPIEVNSPYTPQVIVETLSTEPARYSQAHSGTFARVVQPAIQPPGFVSVLRARGLVGDDNITFTVSTSIKIRYSIERVSDELMKRMILSYTQGSSTIERRG